MVEPLAEQPELLTVEEAAEVLRIGRSLAYQLAGRWLDSGGKVGLPVIKVGRCFRVPKHLLAEIVRGERLLMPSETPAPEPTGRTPKLKRRRASTDQLRLIDPDADQ